MAQVTTRWLRSRQYKGERTPLKQGELGGVSDLLDTPPNSCLTGLGAAFGNRLTLRSRNSPR
jgi:hypothetical protein